MAFFGECCYQIKRRFLCLLLLFVASFPATAQEVGFGLNLGGGSEAIQIEADGMEMRDREGIAIFTGNVSIMQGDRHLRAGKMIVHYGKPQGEAAPASASRGRGLGGTDIEKLEVSNKVYVKSGGQIATGDEGVFDAKANVMVMRGEKVVLIDGDNVASGCKLTANMATGRAQLEGCQSQQNKKGRVSIIMNRND